MRKKQQLPCCTVHGTTIAHATLLRSSKRHMRKLARKSQLQQKALSSTSPRGKQCTPKTRTSGAPTGSHQV
jgi:hypothetical protein